MKAAVFHGAKDIRVEQIAEPGDLGPGDVRLKPHYCGICGTDLHEYAMGPIVIPSKPHALNGSVLPQVLGHEFSAEILEVGSQVKDLAVGDRVLITSGDHMEQHGATNTLRLLAVGEGGRTEGLGDL